MVKSVTSNLPAKWKMSTVGTVYEVLGGGTPSTTEKAYWGGAIPWITSADIDGSQNISSSRYVTSRGIQESATNKVPGRTVLVVTRVGLGKIAISDKPICFSQDIQGLVQDPKLVLPEYCLRYLSLELQRLKFQGRGTTISGLTKKQLKDTNFPLAPYEEQQRIVAKLGQLLSKLDEGVKSLCLAKRALESYREATLKSAFAGKFTAKWRKENRRQLKDAPSLESDIRKIRAARAASSNKSARQRSLKSFAPLGSAVLAELPELPEGWAWDKLGWMTCKVEYGTSAKSSKAGRVPVLRMGNIQNSKFDWSDLVFTSDRKEIAEYLLKDGDVLFNRTNSPELVGKSAIFRGERPAVFAGYLIRINQIPQIVDGQYLNLFLNSMIARRYGNSVKTDGVNQSNINGTKLAEYPFPYCSLAEQREVVRILDKKLSAANRRREEIDLEIAKAGMLRLSILRKAFSGRLIAQDDGDEDASSILVLIGERKQKKERVRDAGRFKRNNNKRKAA